jgi:hypothetical protein
MKLSFTYSRKHTFYFVCLAQGTPSFSSSFGLYKWNFISGLFVCLMVFNATFNNISVISWRSVLLVEETGGPEENHRPSWNCHLHIHESTHFILFVLLKVHPRFYPRLACAYYYWCCEFESWSARGVQHYVIKFVSDLRQVGGFLRVLRFPPPIKLTATI